MNIEQQIYHALLANAGGIQANINKVSQPTLIAMKRGKGKTRFSQLFQMLFDNGVESITLHGKNTEMTFNCIDKDVSVTTKSLTTKDK